MNFSVLVAILSESILSIKMYIQFLLNLTVCPSQKGIGSFRQIFSKNIKYTAKLFLSEFCDASLRPVDNSSLRKGVTRRDVRLASIVNV
ncbi:MAG: hypothetical protein EBS82_04055 [Methylocystaceae bacterium]|nr:hypothetical protein [Methylocystaceae bacterium]